MRKDDMAQARSVIGGVKYDAILDLHNNFRSRKLTSGINAQIARVNKRTLRRWLVVKTKRNWMASEPDVIGRYFEAASKLLDVHDTGEAPSLLPHALSSKRVALCPGSKHWNKQWPVEYYIEIARSLSSSGLTVELFGSTDDVDVCRTIANNVNGVLDHSGKIGLRELPQRMQGFALAITNDSGLMHLASSVGVPTVSFFGPTVKAFGFAPRSTQATALENEGLYCRPCTKIGLDHCPEKHFRCMREITPERALVTVEEVLSRSSLA
jgi:ADP-heptose:LPS heptosyltransferase